MLRTLQLGVGEDGGWLGSTTTHPSWVLRLLFDPNCSCSGGLFYLPTPKYFLYYALWSCLLYQNWWYNKLRNPKLIDFINFLGGNEVLSWCLRLRQDTKYAMHLKPFRVYWSLKYHFYLEKTIAFRQFYLNMSEQMGLFQNTASKLVTRKENKTILSSWTEALLNRPKSMKFLHVRKLKFWITFYV